MTIEEQVEFLIAHIGNIYSQFDRALDSQIMLALAISNIREIVEYDMSDIRETLVNTRASLLQTQAELSLMSERLDKHEPIQQ